MILIRNVKRLLVIIRFVDQLNLRSLSFHTVDYVDGSALTCYGSSCLRCGNHYHHHPHHHHTDPPVLGVAILNIILIIIIILVVLLILLS